MENILIKHLTGLTACNVFISQIVTTAKYVLRQKKGCFREKPIKYIFLSLVVNVNLLDVLSIKGLLSYL